MAAEDAVFTAAVARDEVRKSLVRMEYHMNRGPKGLLGVEREQKFLDALGRQSARLGAGTTGATNVTAKDGLGTRALRALSAKGSGNTAAAGRLRSSLLAEFSQDTMHGARVWTYGGDKEWVWTANASACAACLNEHGRKFTAESFIPMHPSCLCFPQNPQTAKDAGVRKLSKEDITQTLQASNNPEFAKVGRQLADGTKTLLDASIESTRRSSLGRDRWFKAVKEQQARGRTLADTGTGALEPILGASDPGTSYVYRFDPDDNGRMLSKTKVDRTVDLSNVPEQHRQAVLDAIDEAFDSMPPSLRPTRVEFVHDGRYTRAAEYDGFGVLGGKADRVLVNADAWWDDAGNWVGDMEIRRLRKTLVHEAGHRIEALASSNPTTAAAWDAMEVSARKQLLELVRKIDKAYDARGWGAVTEQQMSYPIMQHPLFVDRTHLVGDATHELLSEVLAYGRSGTLEVQWQPLYDEMLRVVQLGEWF